MKKIGYRSTNSCARHFQSEDWNCTVAVQILVQPVKQATMQSGDLTIFF